MSETSNKGTLLWCSFLTLIAAGMGFGVRTGVLAEWSADFGFTGLELGTITGGGLVGFGVVILLASLITDRIGYRAILLLALVLHVVSALVTFAAAPVFATSGKEATYWCLYIGMFLFAVANGLCEAVINPLTAQLYPKEKTHYLNILHAGWPGGLILGGIIGLCFIGDGSKITELPWEIPMGLFLIPTAWYGWILLKERFPVSDVQKAGLSYGDMFKEFAHPVLLCLLVLHACVGYVELGTDSWITTITTTLTQQGFELFIYTSALMFVLRFFAGPIVHRINPLGLLSLSAAVAALGLWSIASFEGVAMMWLAVTIYGLGKTFFWPTMLGVVGERFPRGGAVTMGAIGGVGMLSAGFLGGPGIGYKQDRFASEDLQEKAPETYTRYVAEKESSFLFFKSVKGLDGSKVAVLEDDGKNLAADIEKIENRGDKLSDVQATDHLNTWWQKAEATKGVDKGPVKNAKIYGGRMALKWTALVPTIMLVGYLLLVFYFKSRGGYTQVELEGGDSGGGDSGGGGS